MNECVSEAGEMFVRLKEQFAHLASAVPQGQYYRYNGQWRWVVQHSVYLASLMIFLKEGRALTLENAQKILGGEFICNPFQYSSLNFSLCF